MWNSLLITSKFRRRLVVFMCLFLAISAFIEYFLIPRFYLTHSESDLSNEASSLTWPRPAKIAVLAVTAPPYMAQSTISAYSKTFHSYLPITIAAWRRLGYATFVIIIGSPKPWFLKGHYLNYLYEMIDQKLPGSAKFHFIETNATQWISHAKTAQIIRLYASYLEPVRNLTDSYMVTADVDTLPLHDIYSLPNSSYTVRISIPKRRTFFRLGSSLTLGTVFY